MGAIVPSAKSENEFTITMQYEQQSEGEINWDVNFQW